MLKTAARGLAAVTVGGSGERAHEVVGAQCAATLADAIDRDPPYDSRMPWACKAIEIRDSAGQALGEFSEAKRLLGDLHRTGLSTAASDKHSSQKPSAYD
jgi:hypothetical protein